MLLISKTYRTAAVIATLALGLSACAESTSIVKTFHDGSYDGTFFNNFLVITVAGSSNSRTLFEQSLVSRLIDVETSASAYYAVMGRKQPIERDMLSIAVRSRGFDAVLLTRPVNRNLPVVDLFRFDYDELNQPNNIDVSNAVELMTELYSAADQKRIWAIRSTSAGSDSAEEFVDVHAAKIVAQLQKDALIH
ncbi:MAG: hypothetical protein V3R21_03480 [Woeseiaceae bacterium]